jgi:hypothetical protein
VARVTRAFTGPLALVALVASLLLAGPASAAAPAGEDPSPAAAAQGPRVYLASNCINPRYRPTTIIVACADAGAMVRGVTWSEWTNRLANGSGYARINDCAPNCAVGTFHSYPVLVTLSAPRPCPNTGRTQFTRVTLFFSAQRPVGYAQRTTYSPGCGLDRD